MTERAWLYLHTTAILGAVLSVGIISLV